MDIIKLRRRPNIEGNQKLIDRYEEFEKLLTELRKRDIPDEIAGPVNELIEQIHLSETSHKKLAKELRKTRYRILKVVEKKLKLVPKNHYRNQWLAIGMAVFGVPIGVALGTGAENMGLIGAGLPIGMVVGIGIGSDMDKKAREQGRQLDLESRF